MFHRIVVRIAVVALALVVLTSPVSAVVLTWEGDVDNNWLGGTVGTDTNWTDGVGTPPADQLQPTGGQDVVIGAVGTATSQNLVLGGAVTVNSVTVLQQNFGASLRKLAVTSGTLNLGAGGIKVTMLSLATGGHKEIEFERPIALTANSIIQRLGNFGSQTKRRKLIIDGVISGAFDLELDNVTTEQGNREIQLTRNNTFGGDGLGDHDVLINGMVSLTNAGSLGANDNVVKTATLRKTRLNFNQNADNMTVAQDFLLGSGQVTRLSRTGNTNNADSDEIADLTLSGNITGGAGTKILDLEAPFDTNTASQRRRERRMILTGATQDFSSMVNVRGGTDVILAETWDNAGRVILNSTAANAQNTTSLMLGGAFTLTQNIEVNDIGQSSGGKKRPVATLGVVNYGGGPYAATYSGNINIEEDDYQALQLTADAGSTATFTGNIYSSKGGFNKGFKIDSAQTTPNDGKGYNTPQGMYGDGTGTVILEGYVARGNGTGTTPIGPVLVNKGTLLVNTDDFYATTVTVADGATLGGDGGDGDIDGNIVVQSGGSLAPGRSIDLLNIDGDVTFGAGSFFDVEIADTSSYDELYVTGTAMLAGTIALHSSGTVDLPYCTGLVILTAGAIEGEFDGLDASDVQLADPGLLWEVLYDSRAGTVTVHLVPEPATLALVGVGLLALVRRRRKR